MRWTALERLERDQVAAMRVADDIQHTLARASTKRDLEEAVFAVLDLNDRVLRRHVQIEAATVLAVAHEHVAAQHTEVLDGAHEAMERIEEQLAQMRAAVELGRPLRPVLEETELALRSFVDHEQRVLLPWARQHLGPSLMREVELRFNQHDTGPQAVAARLAGRAMEQLESQL